MKARRTLVCFAALLAAAPGLAPTQAAAQAVPDSVATVQLDGGQVDGVTAVNMAAGNANQQANAGVVALGDAAWAAGAINQVLSTPGDEGTANASAGIVDGAFSESNGWIAVNLAAGSANQQANLNLMAIGIDAQVASAALLSQIRGPVMPQQKTDDSSPREAAVRIGDGAFEDSSGLVQLSLMAGDRNSGANVFAMTLAEPIN